LQLEFIYENFLMIFIVFVIVIILFIAIFLRLVTLKIGDEVFEFAENTLSIRKAKREVGEKLSMGETQVSRDFAPYLLKRGFGTKRVYLLEEGSSKTTDLFEKRSKGGIKDIDKAKGAMKATIIESSVMQKMLKVFA